MADQALYGRRCRLLIAIPVATPGNFSDTQIDRLEVNGGDGRTPGLRIAFKITKTAEKEPNTAEITVSNLSPARRSSLQAKGVKVHLEAGYEATGLSRLFVGDARSIDHVRDGANWNTIIKCGDGERAYRFARVNESFASGVTAGDILRRIADRMGLPLGNVDEKAAALTFRFDHGYVAHGPAQAALDRLARSVGLTFSIQDGQLQVLGPDEALSQSIPEISPETGLIGSPEMGTPEKPGKPALVKLKTLLLPTAPGKLVRLKSKRYDGQLRVKKLTHSGDTHGGDWYTEIQGVIHG